jgi:hypothetical protein
MPFALILMIKNEEKILRRCLESVENLVDYFCITDTGSTDKSVAIAEDFLQTHKGRVFKDEWKNFGHNRSLSFSNTQEYLKSLNCDLNSIYGLLIDADMVFMQGTLQEQTLDAIGYKFIQANGNLEYYNTRLVRMDFSWKCLGVTHEYWDGETESISKDICYIQDHNDGGCKSDKFQRDEILLLKGLEDEPKNVRYMFYLAQTYKCLSRWEDAIAMYKIRIAAGGWVEEIWYSYYSIGDCYRNMKNMLDYEKWMVLAHMYRPCRAESIYSLAKYFREIGEHYKSYHYIKLCQNTPFPKDDVLFIETNVYSGLFDYEASIIEYYIHRDKCLERTIKYMLKMSDFQDNCVSNLKFAVGPIKNSKITKLNFPNLFGDDYRQSAISISSYPMANVRYINYWIENGEYLTKNGSPVQTHNAYINLETNEVVTKMDDLSIKLERYDTNIKGLEDIRLFTSDDKLRFTATSVREYQQDAVRVVTGDYCRSGNYENVKVFKTPLNSSCEKNWLPINNTNKFIYGWHPYRIIDNEGNLLNIVNTPPLFKLFRGSAPPLVFRNEVLVLVHFVEYSKPRKYYHCFVKLSRDYSKLIAVSLPFFFRENAIEYCISVVEKNDSLACFASLNDADPHEIVIEYSDIKWLSI